jgi:hypothetical protein
MKHIERAIAGSWGFDDQSMPASTMSCLYTREKEITKQSNPTKKGLRQNETKLIKSYRIKMGMGIRGGGAENRRIKGK